MTQEEKVEAPEANPQIVAFLEALDPLVTNEFAKREAVVIQDVANDLARLIVESGATCYSIREKGLILLGMTAPNTSNDPTQTTLLRFPERDVTFDLYPYFLRIKGIDTWKHFVYFETVCFNVLGFVFKQQGAKKATNVLKREKGKRAQVKVWDWE